MLLNSSERTTIKNAMRYFDIFYCHEVPIDESEWTQSDFEIDDINTVLGCIYDDDVLDFPNPDLSDEDLQCILSALSVYRSIIQNDVKTTFSSKISNHEKELILNNVNALFSKIITELQTVSDTVTFNEFIVTPDSNYL